MTTEKPEMPFEPDFDSFCRWLATLPRIGSRDTRYTALFTGLQALNAAEPGAHFHFSALEEVSVPVFQAAANLTSVVIGKSFPLSVGMRKLAKLGAQFHAELARGYSRIAQGENFTRDFCLAEQGKIIHSAFRSFNQMLLRMALMYEPPPTSFWLRLNELYRQAEGEGLADWSAACPELAQAEPASVEDLYQRILIFRLSEPLRQDQAQIQRFFDLLQQYGGLVSLRRWPFEEGRKADFSVDLDSSSMPYSLCRKEGSETGDLRYLFLAAFRRRINELGLPPFSSESGLSANLSKTLQNRLGASLVPLPGKKSRFSTLIAGYSSLAAAMPVVGAGVGSSEAFGNLMLLSPDEHVLPSSRIESSKSSGTFRLSSSALSLSPGGGAENIARGMKCMVSPADTPGFYVVELPGIALPVGGLVGLFTDSKLIQFGLVCPGCNELAPYEYGFELLANEVGLARVVFDTNPKKTYRCFFSSLGNGRFSLITPPLRLRNGEGMAVDRQGYGGEKEKYRISRLLGKTAEYCHFELLPEAAAQAD